MKFCSLCVIPWKFTMNSSDIDSPLTKVMTVALLMTPTHTHTSTHTAASCAAFGLVAAATAVRRLLTSWGSGAMLRHPTLQGHVLRSKCKRTAFLRGDTWAGPTMSTPQHFNMHLHSPYYCNTRESACKYAHMKTNTHRRGLSDPVALPWHFLTKPRNLWRGLFTTLAPDRCRTRVCNCFCYLSRPFSGINTDLIRISGPP